MVVAQYVSLSGERSLALPTVEVLGVPVFVHRLCVFTGKYELQQLEQTEYTI